MLRRADLDKKQGFHEVFLIDVHSYWDEDPPEYLVAIHSAEKRHLKWHQFSGISGHFYTFGNGYLYIAF